MLSGWLGGRGGCVSDGCVKSMCIGCLAFVDTHYSSAFIWASCIDLVQVDQAMLMIGNTYYTRKACKIAKHLPKPLSRPGCNDAISLIYSGHSSESIDDFLRLSEAIVEVFFFLRCF